MTILSLYFVFFARTGFALQKPSADQLKACDTGRLKSEIKTIWYVPKGQAEAHGYDTNSDTYLKKYVVQGDALLPDVETSDLVCGQFVVRSKVASSTWFKKTDLAKFNLVDFGADDVPSSQKKGRSANQTVLEIVSNSGKAARLYT